MSISTDVAKLEELQKFAAFFDFISNPTQYVELVNQVSQTIGDMKATIDAHTTVQEALIFLARAQATLEEAQSKYEENMAKIDEDNKNASDYRAAQQTDLDNRIANVLAREANANDAVLVNQIEHNRLSDWAINLQSMETSLNLRQRVLESQEAELAVAKAKVAAFLGA